MSDLVIKDPRYFVKLRAVEGYEGPWADLEKYFKDTWLQVASISSFQLASENYQLTELVLESGQKWPRYLYVKGTPDEIVKMIREAVSP